MLYRISDRVEAQYILDDSGRTKGTSMPGNIEYGITGSTGGIGSRVAAALADRGITQRLIVRDPTRAPQLPDADVTQATYADGLAMRRALGGVKTLFLVSGSEAFDRVQQHKTAIDAAVEAGVQRIVYLSFLAASPDSTFTFARDHYHTEEYIRATGLAHTFNRSSLYLDYIPFMTWDDGAIRGPGGSGRVAWVSREDVADAAVAVLTGSGHDGKAYDITGPEAITFAEAAEQLSLVTGRRIAFQDETLEEARISRSKFGAPDWEVEGWVTTYAAVAAGELDVVSDAVLTLTGHPPLTVLEYFRRHPESYSNLVSAQ
jgi:NAD(P)H dehydrogenase (quinone)